MWQKSVVTNLRDRALSDFAQRYWIGPCVSCEVSAFASMNRIEWYGAIPSSVILPPPMLESQKAICSYALYMRLWMKAVGWNAGSGKVRARLSGVPLLDPRKQIVWKVVFRKCQNQNPLFSNALPTTIVRSLWCWRQCLMTENCLRTRCETRKPLRLCPYNPIRLEICALVRTRSLHFHVICFIRVSSIINLKSWMTPDRLVIKKNIPMWNL